MKNYNKGDVVKIKFETNSKIEFVSIQISDSNYETVLFVNNKDIISYSKENELFSVSFDFLIPEDAELGIWDYCVIVGLFTPES